MQETIYCAGNRDELQYVVIFEKGRNGRKIREVSIFLIVRGGKSKL